MFFSEGNAVWVLFCPVYKNLLTESIDAIFHGKVVAFTQIASGLLVYFITTIKGELHQIIGKFPFFHKA